MFDDFANRQIGDFIIQERIGRGAMSVVYRAIQQSVNRSVSFKVINLALNPLAQENYQPYFMQEARVVATLEHIHIVPVYHYGTIDEESSFIAMRLLRGGAVQTLLRGGRVNLERAVDIFVQASQGLAHAHNRGIIHRDLKPTNILLDDLGNAYLTDFGLGKLAEVSLDLTEAGQVIGTALYASPEQLTGEDIDQRTDIFSMSAILYHLLAGRPPFEMGDGGLATLIHNHETTTPPSLCEIDGSIPPEVDRIIHTGLARDPDDRPESIEEMADSLSLALGRRISRSSDPAVYITDQAPIVMEPAPPRPGGRARRYAVAGALIVALLAALAVGALTMTPRPAGPVVAAGLRGSPEDTQPQAAEIQQARARLGDSGFIAYIACTLDSEFQAARGRVMAEQAAAYDLPFRVYDSGLDRYEQITLIERARLDGARAIILCTLDSTALGASLAAAQQAKIPLVYVTPQEPRYGGVSIDHHDRAMGEMAGRLAGEVLLERERENGRVVLLEAPMTSNGPPRAAGVTAGLAETAPDAEIVARVPGTTAANGEKSIGDLIAAGTRFDLIVSLSDAAALGAVRALEGAGIPPEQVAVISIDGEELARQYLDDRYYFEGDVAVDRDSGARAALDASVRLLGGGAVPEFIDVPPPEALRPADAVT